MDEKRCAICHAKIESEDAPIIAMGGYGVPRYLCDECATDIECATEGTEYEKIDAAMDRVSEKLVKADADDALLLTTLTKLLGEAAERAEKIKDGTYNKDLEDGEVTKELVDEDEEALTPLEEIPEELLEAEEDRLKDEEEAEFEKKVNKVLDWVWLVVLIGAVGFMIWWIFFR